MSAAECFDESGSLVNSIQFNYTRRSFYSPAGCTPRLSSILLVFLAPIFFLGLEG